MDDNVKKEKQILWPKTVSVFLVLTNIKMYYNIRYITCVIEKEIIMPPKPKITKEMIIDAGFHIARTQGADKITARNISQQLNCSTQPVLYYFSTVEEIKKAVYQAVDEYHSGYIMNMEKNYKNSMLTIGMNYIRFAIEESNLFQFLFQSNEFTETGIMELVQKEDVVPGITVLQEATGTSTESAKEIFTTLFIFAHGYASLFANNEMTYDETEIRDKLEKVFRGAIYVEKENKHAENNI